MATETRLTEFEQLTVWQEAQNWAVAVYRVTKNFPKEEQYGLTSQLRRAVSSISANIAEGFGRKSPKDKLHFYTMAYGSALEVKNFLYLAEKLGYLKQADLEQLLDKSVSVQRLLNAFMRPLK
jgi:four helix bundle protein